MGNVVHQGKTGSRLTGTEYEAADAHIITLDAGDVGAEAAGAVATHAGLADPHPGYLTPAEGNAAYEAAGAVTTHAGLADPHPGYLTPAEGNAAYDALGAAAAHTGDTSDAHDASAISFTPAGTIAATDVQAAIEEVAAEAAGGGAPTAADYLVGTAHAGLSAEIVVGTTPGGELGGTWGSPTVDSTHSGSAHSDAIAKAIVDAKGDLIAASAADTPVRLAAGSNGAALLADSTATEGLSYAMLPLQGVLPTGALAQTHPRYISTSNGMLSTARLHLVAIWLPKGITVGTISFVSGTNALSVGVNQWFALFDSSRNKLAVTNDDTSTAWASNSVKTLTISGGFVTTYSGVHYLGIMVKATTVPNLIGTNNGNAAVTALPPILSGTSDTGLTDPASCPNPATALAAVTQVPYAYVS